MIDIVCVCVGTAYQPELYVEQLRLGVAKHLTIPHRVNVITDNPNLPYYVANNIRTIQTQDWTEANGDRKYWWYKMQMFNRECGFTDTVLYFDLDVVITGPVDKFVDYHKDKFAICQDFNRKWILDYKVSNSSIMRFHAPTYYEIYNAFVEHRTKYMRKNQGDQDYITKYFAKRKDKIWWPKTWAQSFKWEVHRGGLIESGTGLGSDGSWPADASKYHVPNQPWVVSSDCSVVVFHGKPKPWDTEFGKQYQL
jgi:hypothetical protein